ncbi:MLV-related proviral Env polyprotein-like [Suncus etruscus]|uniref:MLV-related proviral Env polyprotein-like n=1 Tax=Suncus etruscus TaxID=109475 RepID=UPI00210FEA96|nr:MLV-related proviral Env polyprotein-like [Suncus etruscus]
MPAFTTPPPTKLGGYQKDWLNYTMNPGTLSLRILLLFLLQMAKIKMTAWPLNLQNRFNNLPLLFFLTLSSLPPTPAAFAAAPGPYQVYNFTWVILTETGDVANATSIIAPTVPWPDLFVDMCALPTPSDYWVTPDFISPHNDLQPKATPGCYSALSRSSLLDTPIYVCPGGFHRDQHYRSLAHSCGDRSSFFCAAWGCETTGDTHWTPSSSWDFITVRRLRPPIKRPLRSLHPCYKGWCNPLHIQFTTAGKKYSWDNTLTWGLRLYCTGYDKGFTFSIKLLKEIPFSRPIAVGPNPLLHPSGGGPFLPQAPPKALPPPPPCSFTAKPDAAAAAVTKFQPTIPAGPVSTADLILQMVNASAQALSITPYERCWICYSPVPPFYEGIAAFGTPLYTNDSGLLRWGTQPQRHGLTVGQVVGYGLCLLGPQMIPPIPLLETCNQTFHVHEQALFLIAPNFTFFVCSTRLTPHIIVNVFLAHRDYCVLAILMPKLTVQYESDLLPHSGTSPGLSRAKREPVTAITLAVLVGLGAAGAGTGIYSLIRTEGSIGFLTNTVVKDIEELKKGLDYLQQTVGSLAEMVLQNRRALDLAFLKEGGMCVALKEECCFFKDKLGLVKDSIKKVEESLAETKKTLDREESWYKNWFSTSPWLSTLLSTLLGPFIGFMLLISFGPWAFCRLIGFIKTQINEATKKSVGIYYQQLQPHEPPIADTTEGEESAPEELDFEELERLAKRKKSFLTRLWKCL